MLSAPTSTAPAASIRSMRLASRADGGSSRLIFDPARVESPCTSNRFLTAKGTPASGPGFLPVAIAESIARAFARARVAVTSVKEFRSGSCLAILARVASMKLSAVTFPPCTAEAISAADRASASAGLAGSGCKDICRLGLIGQHKFIDQPRQPQRHLEIGLHGRLPRRLNRQRQRRGDGLNVIIKRIGDHYPRSFAVSGPARGARETPSAPCIANPRAVQDGLIRRRRGLAWLHAPVWRLRSGIKSARAI